MNALLQLLLLRQSQQTLQGQYQIVKLNMIIHNQTAIPPC